MDASSNPCREFPQGLLVSAEVIHHQVYSAPGPGWQHMLQPERSAGFGRFVGESFAYCDTGVGRKGTEPLQGSVSFVSIRAKPGSLTPCLSATGDRLQRAHFVKADNLPPARAVAVDANYSVFFTSNSGSVLLHQV